MITPSQSSDELFAAPEEAGGPSPIENILFAIGRSLQLVVVIALLGMLVGLGLSIVQPNVYTSQGRLFLRGGARETTTFESAVTTGGQATGQGFRVAETELEILSSRQVYAGVVEKVGIDKILAPYDPAANDNEATPSLIAGMHRLQSWWFARDSGQLTGAGPLQIEEAAIQKVLLGLSVFSGSTPSIIEVHYSAETPGLAQRVVEAYLETAKERHEYIFSAGESLDYLSNKEEAANQVYLAATARLREFRDEHQLFGSEEEHRQKLTQLLRLEGQLAEDKAQLESLQVIVADLDERLIDEPDREFLEVEGEHIPNPIYSSLAARLDTAEDRLFEHYVDPEGMDGERRTKQQKIEDQIKSLKAELAQVEPTLPPHKSLQAVLSEAYVQLKTDLYEKRTELLATQNLIKNRQTTVAALRERLSQLEALTPDYERLISAADLAKAELDRRRQNRERIGELAQLDDAEFSNLQTLEPADYPLQKSGPKRGKLTAVFTMLGLFAGIALAMLRQFTDKHVRRESDLLSAGAESVAVVPKHKALRDDRYIQLLAPPEEQQELPRVVQRAIDAMWISLMPTGLPAGSTRITFTSERFGNGVSAMALFAAAGIARNLDVPVLFVETNYHDPKLAELAGLEDKPGLVDILNGSAVAEDAIQMTPTPNLAVLHAGQGLPEHGRGLASRHADALWLALSEHFRVIIFDLPPVTELPEFRPLLWRADVTANVFAADLSEKSTAKELTEAGSKTPDQTEVTILNRWTSIRPAWLPGKSKA